MTCCGLTKFSYAFGDAGTLVYDGGTYVRQDEAWTDYPVRLEC